MSTLEHLLAQLEEKQLAFFAWTHYISEDPNGSMTVYMVGTFDPNAPIFSVIDAESSENFMTAINLLSVKILHS